MALHEVLQRKMVEQAVVQMQAFLHDLHKDHIRLQPLCLKMVVLEMHSLQHDVQPGKIEIANVDSLLPNGFVMPYPHKGAVEQGMAVEACELEQTRCSLDLKALHVE